MFKDQQHEEYFNKFMAQDETIASDRERKALFYTLALFEETRTNIKSLYSFGHRNIQFHAYNAPWQTGGTRAVTKLAFNLYNGFDGSEMEDCGRVTPLSIFCAVSDEYREYLYNAIKIRLREIDV